MHYHLVGSSAHPSAVQSCPEPTKKKTKRVRLLRKEEHSVVQDIDKAAVLLHVRRSVPMGLVSSLFPEHKRLWDSITNSEEFETFIVYLADKYISLYQKYSKGKEKEANLYLAWLDVIRSFTTIHI